MICFRAALAFLAITGTAAAASPKVDLALVLAVDVSNSIDRSRYELQRRGFAEAFRSEAVHRAIASGEQRAIAVTLVEWSGQDQQKQVLEWTLISDPASSCAFAAAILESTRSFAGFTSISAVVDFSASLLAQGGIDAERKVIDVSGDGVNNAGRPPAEARDEAVAKGIVINGIAITAHEPGLERYYGDHVVGGPGSFLTIALEFEAFPDAILGKLVREIAAAPSGPSPSRSANAESARRFAARDPARAAAPRVAEVVLRAIPQGLGGS